MNTQASALGNLPATGFIRQADLIGKAPVTPEQAASNKRRKKGPKRPRPGRPPIIPWSAATLWRKIKNGEFVAPVKLSQGVTAWPVDAVRAWIHARSV